MNFLSELEELRNLNNALQESNRNLKEELERKDALINNLPCTVSWINSDLEYLSINKELEDLFEISKGTFERKKVGFLKKQDNPFLDFMQNLFDEKKMYSEIEYSINVNGEIHHQWVMAQKYKDEKEAVVIGFDVTEKAKLKEKIDDGEKLRLIGELATGIVHEIKNPLTVILGSAEMASERLDQNTPDSIKYAQKSFEKILKMNDRINTIINGLKNLARDNSTDAMEPTDLALVIDESLVMCKNKLNKYAANLKLNNTVSKETRLSCIEGQVIQVLVNLIGNAAEENCGKDKNWINLDITEDENLVWFRVVDSGEGIPGEVLEKIFEPFFTTKAKGIGTGMGLGICQKIVENHVGELKYELIDGHTSFVFPIEKA